MELTTKVNERFINTEQTDVIYTDFSKAFNRANHDILLHKLSCIGFSNNAVRWLKSYLSSRTQQKKFEIDVASGVPQRSHLGPVLFTLFINVLPSVIIHSNILLYEYADDVKIFNSLDSISGQSSLEKDIDYFCQWCEVNLLELNFNKCKHMTFHRSFKLDTSYNFKDKILKKVLNITDIGILLDHKLRFSNHISMMVNKASGVLGFIKH